MKNSLIPISTIDFNNTINIKFNNILDGFDFFKNFTIDGNVTCGEEKIITFIEKIFEENIDDTYIDFYINRISSEDKSHLMNLISDNDKNTLREFMNITHDGVYFKLIDKNLIPFFVRLNTKEVFFVTFYFNNRPITVWGNYNMKFPCFVNNDEDLEYYLQLASKLNLA
ncbi:hypothetical protein [Clostridium neonatale]|uniref:DUF3885 domain-containing protein n=1 Tax=Clostridium neonatale TaxID=137838 RepID=A0A653ANR7_9CLOT|nr:hypothetical protein [Clostridium neonatale]MBP8314597.1 hypothetical protein [Clostridium neonatale]CAG9710128.1 Conserved hypothetical protein [Clostridium neonatale]CAI3555271.1 Conserved hypothetical protein [Clostridium neonatale]CAI3555328.1 Conserved hypothetical protein [Clostridium neonatale]CAI3557879.1 Conserved hypothetical protein [Clostridium neonatale]